MRGFCRIRTRSVVSGVRPMRYSVAGLPEAADAKQFAEWGFDYLKYDWCSYGGVAVALVNLSSRPRRITLDLAKDLGLGGTWTVRDLWRMRDLGTVTGTFASDVLVHACTLVKLTPGEGAGLLPGVGDCRERAWRRLFDGRTESGARGCAGCN